MAYDFFGMEATENSNTIRIDGETVELPDSSYIRDAAMIRDGADLILDGPQGTITIEGYFSAANAPDLAAPGGLVLSPELVESFARSPAQFAQSLSLNDESPVGAIDEISGNVTITRLDGSVEPVMQGTPVYQGDVIETGTNGAVNISFIDDTSFAVSEEARLAIDEYVFDPATEAGTQNFSVLKGVFVFTSGLIGREDPDDVNISTPSGSIGIRGTIIAGNADTGEITVVEGAIVVRDLQGHEITLDDQFETAQIKPLGGVENLGQVSAKDVADRFEPVSKVSPTLFSSINDAMAEQAMETMNNPQEQPHEEFDAEGSVDQNNDTEVDGTIDESTSGGEEGGGEGLLPTEGPLLEEETFDETPRLESEPLPPPPSGTLGTVNTLDTNTDGLRTEPLPGTHPPTEKDTTTQNHTTSPEDGVRDSTMPPPPPPQDLQDPDTITHPPANNGNTAPINFNDLSPAGQHQHNGAPIEFFSISDGQAWDYHFDLDFFDIDAGDALTYTLTGDTSSANVTLGAIDPNTGFLTITAGTLPQNENFSFTVTATDSAGASNSHTYSFTAYQKTATPGSSIDGVSSGVYTDSANTSNSVLIGNSSAVSGTKIFAGDGTTDNITLIGGNNNDINLGNGENIININSAAGNIDNTIIGGFDKDTVQFYNVNNKVFAMDGDDIIKINLSSGTAAADLKTAGQNIFIDGGHDNFIPSAAPDGKGDTLVLEGTGVNLDFGLIDDGYIKGIERLDLTQTTSANITLGITDVIEMTDHHNTLIIRADDDTLNFVAGDFSGFTKNNDQQIDDTAGVGPDINFDVYTNGNVTLLVEDVGANINGLP